MAEENLVKAKETYDCMCAMLDENNWHYEKIESDLTIKSAVKGDDLPIEFVMKVNPRNQVVSFISWMPFKIDEAKRLDMALAVCAANFGMADGSFDFDIESGALIFRLTTSYRESVLSKDIFEYMLYLSSATVDKYNDKFFMISKGMLSVQQFIESEK